MLRDIINFVMCTIIIIIIYRDQEAIGFVYTRAACHAQNYSFIVNVKLGSAALSSFAIAHIILY